MATATDICNRALSMLGTQVQITTLGTDVTPAGVQCTLWYNTLRQALLQAAPWGFARATLLMTTLGLYTDTPPAAPWPWLVKYEYPADCLRVNYILPPPFPASGSVPDVSGGPVFLQSWGMPSRQFRFIKAYDVDDSGMSPVPRTVILSNLLEAYVVYILDVTDTTLFDASFENALSASLAYKLTMPLTGNVGMMDTFRQIAQLEITQARVIDVNQAINSADHTVDWIAARGTGAYYSGGVNWSSMGQWWGGFSEMSWGM